MTEDVAEAEKEVTEDWEIGDSIIYPHYGAGEIVDEETIERDGEETDYYVIDILLKQQKVMLPKNEEQEVGVRKPSEEDEFYGLLEDVSDSILDDYDPVEGTHPEKIHRKTLQSMLDDVRQGDLETMMEGLEKLHTRFLDQELNVTEKRFYDTAQQFIIGEIMAISDVERGKAHEILNEYLPTELPEAEEPEEEDEDEDS